MAEPIIMRSPEGRLYEIAPEQVEAVQRDQGYVPASEEEVGERTGEREQYAKYGSTGQQALGLADAAVRNFTVGAFKGVPGSGTEDERRERAQVVQEESPVLYEAARLAPTVALALAPPLLGGAAMGSGVALGSRLAVEGLHGARASLSIEKDAAFLHDQELSAENAVGSMVGGFLLGGALSGAAAGAGKVLGGVRNRFVEASGKAARKAEQEAFTASGVVRPAQGLGEAIDDPVKAAAMRQAGNEARPVAQQKLVDELGAMETAELAAQQSTASRALDDAFPSSPTADIAAQRSATRNVIHGARTELEPIAPPALRGRMERAMEALDAADDPAAVFGVAQTLRRGLDEALDASDDPAVAAVLKKYATQARELEGNSAIFGRSGDQAASRTAQLDALTEARIALRGQLEAGPYLAQIGTAGAKPIDDALDTYMTRLDDVLRSSKEPSAKEGLAAIGRLRAARDNEFQVVAGGNQADVLRQFAIKGAKEPSKSPMRDIMGEVLETAVESQLGMGFGLVRKAWKYRKHILRLAGVSRKQAEGAADRILGAVTPDIRKIARGARSASVSLGMRTFDFQRGDEQPEVAYSRVREVVRQLVQEPEKLSDALAAQMGDMGTEAPELLQQVNEKAARIVDFLQSKMPPAFEYSLLYPDGPPPSRTDIMQMSLYWNGVTRPEDVLKAIGDGSAMPEEVEAFRAANPAWFIELQESIQERIVKKNQSGEVVPGYRIAQLETLLDLPGGLDPAFSDSVARIAGNAREVEQQQTQAPSYVPKPRAGDRIKTPSQERIQ